MIDLYTQILETWQVNNKVNLMILDHITDDVLDYTFAPRGGGKIGHQFAHMYNVRYWKIENAKRPLVKDFQTIKSADPKSIEFLKERLTTTSHMIEEIIADSLENEGQVKGFNRGLVPFIGYFISHEAHHRGNILLTLKNKGFKFPDELKYGIWEWNKI